MHSPSRSIDHTAPPESRAPGQAAEHPDVESAARPRARRRAAGRDAVRIYIARVRAVYYTFTCSASIVYPSSEYPVH